MKLSPGKLRALDTLSNARGIFTILALDHTASLKKIFWGSAAAEVSDDALAAVKLELVRALAPHASAVLLDPVYGIGPALAAHAVPGSVGLMALVEEEGAADARVDTSAVFVPGWSVAAAKRVGAAGIKYYFYYNHKDTDKAARQDALIQHLVADCAAHEIPFFAEPIHYGVEPAGRRRLVIENAQRMSALGADILKLEFPVDARVETDERVWREACEELTQAVGRPWTLLSAGAAFDTFKRQVAVACAAGASGFVAGRAIWQEASDLEGAARAEFLMTVAAARLQELSALANAYARPWREWYTAKPVSKDWFFEL